MVDLSSIVVMVLVALVAPAFPATLMRPNSHERPAVAPTVWAELEVFWLRLLASNETLVQLCCSSALLGKTDA